MTTSSGVSCSCSACSCSCTSSAISCSARWNGVRVLTFSLGFGPKLLKVQRGDTEYCISAIPLGGYVKMAGENPDDPRTGAADEFLSKIEVAAVPDPDRRTG